MREKDTYSFVMVSGKCQNFLTHRLLITLSRLPLKKHYPHPGPPSLEIAKYTIKNSSY